MNLFGIVQALFGLDEAIGEHSNFTEVEAVELRCFTVYFKDHSAVLVTIIHERLLDDGQVCKRVLLIGCLSIDNEASEDPLPVEKVAQKVVDDLISIAGAVLHDCRAITAELEVPHLLT